MVYWGLSGRKLLEKSPNMKFSQLHAIKQALRKMSCIRLFQVPITAFTLEGNLRLAFWFLLVSRSIHLAGPILADPMDIFHLHADIFTISLLNH